MKKISLTLVLFCSLSISAQWSEVGGSPLNNLNLFNTMPNVYAITIHCDKAGNIYASVWGDNAGTTFILTWDGTSWQNLGNAGATHSIVKASNGVLYASSNHIARYGSGVNWYEVGGQNALNMSLVFSMCVDSTGNLYAGSYGTNVAKWNNSQWTYLPSISSQTGTGVSALCSDGNGNIYAAGSFTNANGICYVAKWNGTAWSELVIDSSLSSIPNQWIGYLLADNQGNVYAAGMLSTTDNKYYVAKWNGTTWQRLVGSSGLPNGVSADGSGISPAMSIDKYGNVFVVCAGTSIHKWNGSDWINMTENDFHFYYNHTYQPTIQITGICADTSGNLYASLYSTSDNGLSTQAYVLKYSKAYEVGVEELGAMMSDEVRVYPSPADEILNIELRMMNEKPIEVSVYDVFGKEVIHQSSLLINYSARIDVSSLPNGIYFAQITSNKGIGTRKIVVQHF